MLELLNGKRIESLFFVIFIIFNIDLFAFFLVFLEKCVLSLSLHEFLVGILGLLLLADAQHPLRVFLSEWKVNCDLSDV